MKGNYRTLFKRFCLESSVLGLKYLYLYPDRISRCFWSVVIVAIYSLAWTLTYKLYCRFLEMPTRITIENQYEPIQNLPYPAITICSPNQITITAMKHLNKTLVDGNMSTSLDILLPQLMAFYEPIVEFNTKNLELLQNLLELNRYTVPEVMAFLPQSCDDFLKLCSFQKRLHPHCRGLFQPVLTMHGLCCSFNNVYHLRNKRRNERKRNFTARLVRETNILDALTVVADFNPSNALDGTLLNVGGILVLFTDWSEFPTNDVSSVVLSDVETFHILHATYTYCSDDVKQLPVWSRQCYLGDERKLRFFSEYRNSDCDQLCLVEAVERVCGCHMLYVPHAPARAACNITSIPCIGAVKFDLNKWSPLDKCDCPRDCESRRYSVDMSTGNFGALPYVLKDVYAGVTINKSTSIMHFFFRNNVYMKQKQETVMSFISLISNLGGVFGLCLGCSAMSVVEVMFFVYVLIRNCIKKRWAALKFNIAKG